MTDRWGLGARAGAALALVLVGAAALPAACIYPDFAFTEPEATGGGGSGQGGNGAPSSTSSEGPVAGSGGKGQGGSGTGGDATASSAESSSSGSAGGGTPTGEQCWNGLDDDNDGMADCADPDCDPLALCTPNVPFGWSGFAVLFEGVQEPACPSTFPSASPYIGHTTPTSGGATCTGCSCGAPANEKCTMPGQVVVQNKVCGQNPNFTGTLPNPANWNGACYSSNGFPGGETTCNGPCNVSVMSDPTTVTGGACAPDGGVATVPPLKWAILGKACGDALVGGGCGAGKLCLPKPPLPYLSGLCIYKTGDVACPATDFTDQHVFYGNAMDTRGCSSCSCSNPSGSVCKVSMDLYSDAFVNTCNTNIATIPTVDNTGGCVNLSGNPGVDGRKATITQQPMGGTCAPSGGQPVGSITPSEPTTFCCAP